MPSQQRSPLGLDDENPIDLEELTGAGQRPAPTVEQTKAILKAGEQTGFVSREPKKRRRVSPYQAQFGGKCRDGMKPLFQEVAERLDIHDTKALELAIKALIEKHGYDDLLAKYEELTK
ncbi:MAG: hypothetical protein RPU64_09090 [Candidatus Sedimenticola sp. (ex Thyasira tokunagai)]